MIGEKKEGANWEGLGGGGIYFVPLYTAYRRGGLNRGFTVSANYHVNYLGYRASWRQAK